MARRSLLLLVATLCACAGSPSFSQEPQVMDSGATGWVDAGRSDAGALARVDSGTSDARADAGMDCTRMAQTQTADIALLDRLRADLERAQSKTERNVKVDAFLSAVQVSGGTPLQQPDGGTRVAFIAVDAPAAGYSVAGEWNQWRPGVTRLQRVGSSKLYAVEVTLPRNRAYAYKMVDGAQFYEDRRARHVTWDGVVRASVGELNALVYAERQDARSGRLVAWRDVSFAQLTGTRDVFVYLPARYDDGTCERFPSLYVHDGNESVTRGHFDSVANALFAERPADSSVLLFVALPSQNVRLAEYMPYPTAEYPDAHGDAYLDALVNELVPLASGQLRLCAKAADRGIAGASLGGLISARAGFEHSDTFGFVGSQSGSYFWDNRSLISRAASGPVLPLRWYIDYGCTSPDLSKDNCDVNRALVAALEAKGYVLVDQEEAGGQHEWTYWQARLPGLLRAFRADRPECEP